MAKINHINKVVVTMSDEMRPEVFCNNPESALEFVRHIFHFPDWESDEDFLEWLYLRLKEEVPNG